MSDAVKFFVHGVPDTPVIWRPVTDALGMTETSYVPPLPALAAPTPDNFKATPDSYVDWLIGQIEEIAARSGPVDLVGHDWGGLFTVRAASLRPDLIRTWAALNAVPAPDDPWPMLARLWATPLLGEFLMSISPSSGLEKALARQRVSEGMAAHEAAHWRAESRRAILSLYRTGRRIGRDWTPGLGTLPARGLVIWSAEDPFTKPETAQAFCERTGATLHMLEGCGHWSIAERAEDVADILMGHWTG